MGGLYIPGSCSDSCNYDETNQTLTWEWATLAAQRTRQVTFEAKVTQTTEGTIVNEALLESEEFEDLRNQAQVEIELPEPPQEPEPPIVIPVINVPLPVTGGEVATFGAISALGVAAVLGAFGWRVRSEKRNREKLR